MDMTPLASNFPISKSVKNIFESLFQQFGLSLGDSFLDAVPQEKVNSIVKGQRSSGLNAKFHHARSPCFTFKSTLPDINILARK